VSPTTTEIGLREVLLALIAELLGEKALERGGIVLEAPPRADFGDYSSNAALLLAQHAGTAPRALAQRLGEALAQRLGGQLDHYEIAGPGFLNLFLADQWHHAALWQVLSEGERFGGGQASCPERIVVEFVSANPTGPMHVGHARNAAYGDALARVLAFHGHTISREFYVNDAGTQIHKLGASVIALMQGREVPEDGYHGEYMHALADSVKAQLADSPQAQVEPRNVGTVAVSLLLRTMRQSLDRFGVHFDHWAYESELHGGHPSAVDQVLGVLEQHGHTYSKDGALWLKTTDFGDDKDRVLVRSGGEHTYFASDIAYHQDKRERGFDRQIDVWGADHHGYVARMKAAYQALGGDSDELEMLTMQLVHLVRSGERAQMSKRAGEFVTLEELIAEIGVDAARWFLLSRSHDTTVDLDLDLAREQSSDNPVYYVQYAHARIASVLQKVGSERVGRTLEATPPGRAGAEQPLEAAERALVKKLLAFPAEVGEAAARRGPHRLTAYALELAQAFTAFYRDCRVVGAEPATVESTRIALCVACQSTIARCLDLLGVSAPREM
jgi:arginyl-tRNA synthetase